MDGPAVGPPSLVLEPCGPPYAGRPRLVSPSGQTWHLGIRFISEQAPQKTEHIPP